eukprot:6967984-Pyramimonas_sp.AAC.1
MTVRMVAPSSSRCRCATFSSRKALGRHSRRRRITSKKRPPLCETKKTAPPFSTVDSEHPADSTSIPRSLLAGGPRSVVALRESSRVFEGP